MEQVKKDMEADEKGRKDWEAVQKGTAQLGEKTAQGGEKLGSLAERLKAAASSTSEKFAGARDKAAELKDAAASKAAAASEEHESIKQAREFMERSAPGLNERAGKVTGALKGTFRRVMDKTSAAFGVMEDEKSRELKDWQTQREGAREHYEQVEKKKAKAEREAKEKGEEAEAVPDPSAGSSVVVSKDRSSSWDRFGGMGDMPFLNTVFENPLFERVFGESEIAASIREMKQMDPNFRLEYFAEDMEHVVGPHIVRAFLEGDQEALELHCSETTFSAVNSSIKARKKQKVALDSTVLAGPQEFELKGAKLMDQGPPLFIWTFHCQQINCLRDKDGEVVEGDIDDIRQVYYAMLVTRHPDLDNLHLMYPWQIVELAIVGNQATM